MAGKLWLFAAVGLIVVASIASPAKIGPIQTSDGLVEGVPSLDGAVMSYRGIPFAAPPVGDLRWKDPQPAQPWQGVRQADSFGASCYQKLIDQYKPWTWEFMTHGDVSEDCLYLNVWTPAKSSSGPRPVLFFIYGGGFGGGSAEVPIYNGEELAKKGLVVVTANYRLGMFGFFSHPELSAESGHKASGNQGLLDQLAALQWIRKNITAFGGDPNRVAIAGQSAGGASVHALVASPLAKGLFQRAIADSWLSLVVFGGSPRKLADAEQNGMKFAEISGAHSLAELRAMSPEKLTPPTPVAAPTGAFVFQPIIDGYLLLEDEEAAFADGTQNDVPMIQGYNADEGGSTPHPTITAAAFTKQARQRFGDKADEFLKLYPAGSDQEAAASQNQSSRDLERTSVYVWAVRRSKTSKTKTFTYYWDHAIPGPDADRFGAFHTSEVPYFFDSLIRSDRPWQPVDQRIADTLSSYWVNFATSGDPNGKGLANWPALNNESQTTMEIGDKYGSIPVANDAAFKFFRDYLMTAH